MFARRLFYSDNFLSLDSRRFPVKINSEQIPTAKHGGSGARDEEHDQFCKSLLPLIFRKHAHEQNYP